MISSAQDESSTICCRSYSVPRGLAVAGSKTKPVATKSSQANRADPDHDPMRRNRIVIPSFCLSLIFPRKRFAFVARESRFPEPKL
jgi:hypothetical protein